MAEKSKQPRDRTQRDDVAIRDIEFHLANLTGSVTRHCGKNAPARAAEIRKAVQEAITEMLTT